MEFQKKLEPDLHPFGNDKVDDFAIYVSPLTLWHVGGGTIDFRDGRFKLDLPEDKECCGNPQNGCGCAS